MTARGCEQVLVLVFVVVTLLVTVAFLAVELAPVFSTIRDMLA